MDHVPRLNSGMSGTVTVLIGFSKDPVVMMSCMALAICHSRISR